MKKEAKETIILCPYCLGVGERWCDYLPPVKCNPCKGSGRQIKIVEYKAYEKSCTK